MSNVTQDDIWQIVNAYFKATNLAAPQIASFDKFIEYSLTQIALDANEIIVDVEEKNKDYDFTRVKLRIDKIFPSKSNTSQRPNDCRLQNTTYSLDLFANVNLTLVHVNLDKEEQEQPETKSLLIPFCQVPLMLNSKYCYLQRAENRQFPKSIRIEADECPFDEGGYFIINGSEKVVVAQEVSRSNRVLVLEGNQDKHDLFTANVISAIPEKAMYCNIQATLKDDLVLLLSFPGFDKPFNMFTMIMAMWPNDSVTAKELLHVVSPDEDDDIIKLAKITLDEAYEFSNSPADCLKFLAENNDIIIKSETSAENNEDMKQLRMYNHFATRVLPHISIDPKDKMLKILFIGYMCNLLLRAKLGKKRVDDRDHWGMKRMQLTGSLMHDLFRKLFQDFTIGLSSYISKKQFVNQEHLRKDFETKFQQLANQMIFRGLCQGLSTGNWETGKKGQKAGNKTGVSQALVRLSYAASLSQIRRCSSGIEESSKATAPRMYHGTQFGYFCTAETPEGAKVGLVKNFSLQCHVSTGLHNENLKDYIMDFKDEIGQLAVQRLHQNLVGFPGMRIFLNGLWLGNISQRDGKLLADDIKKKRAKKELTSEVSITVSEVDQEIVIASDEGRVMRPLFVVDSKVERGKIESMNLVLQKDHINQLRDRQDGSGWSYLLNSEKCIIEYLDAYEEEQSLIASDLKTLQKEIQNIKVLPTLRKKLPVVYTHMEIHPCLVLSAIASLIPFPDHNQSPRNLYQSSMGKQAVGIYALNFNQRFDNSGINVMHYPQTPLAQTKAMGYVKFKDLPAGENLIVAIAIYTGFNQEDSLIMNQAAVDRGLMRASYIQSHESIIMDEGTGMADRNLKQKFCIPLENIKGKIDSSCDQYLELDGLPKVGNNIRNGRIVIGKVEPKKDSMNRAGRTGNEFLDKSTVIKNDEVGYVDCICIAKQQHDKNDKSSNMTARVRVRASRPPQMGDKFASRHGQKGTVGMLYRHEDMPFSTFGVTPDIIVNPHAIPSRMTIGQLLECVGSKFACFLGKYIDATPFEPPVEGDFQEDFLTQKLHSCGFNKYGYEALFSGFTGGLLNYRIFFGPTFYQRLKHMVLDKVSARATGQLVTLTRQPNEGRQRYGGMRIGEMERDTFIAHGAAAVLRDRLMFSSDMTDFILCRNCGQICWHANVNKLTSQNKPMCTQCTGVDADFAIISIPYATKLLFQEVMAMGIAVKIEVE